MTLSDGRVSPIEKDSFSKLIILLFEYSGENVSTNEVEAVIQKVVQLSDCVVFGVSIPHCDGKAGMTVIADPDRTIDLKTLYEELFKRLPVYAIPPFVRITNHIELTGSYKLSKTKLEKEGYNINTIKDDVYLLDKKTCCYVKLDKKLYDDIQNGLIVF